MGSRSSWVAVPGNWSLEAPKLAENICFPIAVRDNSRALTTRSRSQTVAVPWEERSRPIVAGPALTEEAADVH